MEKSKAQLYDPLRKSWVANTPEERVRQAVTHHLTHALGYPPTLIGNEINITLGKVTRRCDTVVYNRQLRPLMIIEFKAPHIQLTHSVLNQVLEYNSVLQVPVVMISNGNHSALFRIGYQGTPTTALSAIPTYTQLLALAEQ